MAHTPGQARLRSTVEHDTPSHSAMRGLWNRFGLRIGASQEPMRAPELNRLLSFVLHYRREFKRFLKFAIVGTVGFVIDFSVLNLMHKLAPWPLVDTSNLSGGVGTLSVQGWVNGWPLVAANTLSFTLAVLSNFTWNRLWTFPESRSRRKRRQLPQFVLVNVIGLMINTFVLLTVKALVSYVGVPDPFDYNLAKGTATIVVLFWNFGANRLWTYRGL